MFWDEAEYRNKVPLTRHGTRGSVKLHSRGGGRHKERAPLLQICSAHGRAVLLQICSHGRAVLLQKGRRPPPPRSLPCWTPYFCRFAHQTDTTFADLPARRTQLLQICPPHRLTSGGGRSSPPPGKCTTFADLLKSASGSAFADLLRNHADFCKVPPCGICAYLRSLRRPQASAGP